MNMADPIEFDNKGQKDRIEALLMPDEQLYAVYDMKGGGTGFVGITDLRLIFLDQAFLRKKKSMVSLPYTHITAIAGEDTGGILFSTSMLTVLAGNQEWEFQFRSTGKAHKVYQLIMRNLLQSEKRGM
jgi:hypothetical protein